MDIEICKIPAENYPIGDDALPNSRPEHTVRLKAFALAKTAVTNAQYAAFLAAEGHKNQVYWTDMGWRWQQGRGSEQPAFWKDRRFNAPDQPIVGLSWYEALAFTRWLASETGLPWRLPTEAEWEAAARGTEGRAPMPRLYNTAERGLGHPWPVTKPSNISWCGASDMCGNVWEWCSTRWGRNWQTMDYAYPYVDGDGREFLDGAFARVIRGGSWFDPLTEANPANRGRYLPGSRGSNIGLRLVRSL